MKTTIRSDLIPQMTFVGGKRPDGLYHWRQSAYASVRGTKHLLATAIGYLEVSKFQLGQLLGYAAPSHVYGLFSGKRRPSQLFLSRLAWLFFLRSEGHELSLWRAINWMTGEITLRSVPRRCPGVRANGNGAGSK